MMMTTTTRVQRYLKYRFPLEENPVPQPEVLKGNYTMSPLENWNPTRLGNHFYQHPCPIHFQTQSPFRAARYLATCLCQNGSLSRLGLNSRVCLRRCIRLLLPSWSARRGYFSAVE